MVSGTSDFKEWLREVDAATQGLGLVPSLDTVARRAAEAFGARLWFVEILGRRWSYIAGARGDDPTGLAGCRVPLSERTGLVCDTWGILAKEQQDNLMSSLRSLVEAKEEDWCQTAKK